MDSILETLKLKALITDETFKIPDKNGLTPLLFRAKENSLLTALSPEKKFQENLVCNLINYFDEFDNIKFSELESYILVSDFPGNKISDTFQTYVRNEKENEDIEFIGYVARTVQHLNRSSFSLEYICKRFNALFKINVWLFSELVILCNWKEGVKIISQILNSDNSTNYLFSLLPFWMEEQNNPRDISFALSEWYPLLNSNDKEIVQYYAENYGYEIESLTAETKAYNSKAVEEIVGTNAFIGAFRSKSNPYFESLSI